MLQEHLVVLRVCEGAYGNMIHGGGSIQMLFVVLMGNVAHDLTPVALWLWETVPWAYAQSRALPMTSLSTTPALH